MSNDSRTEIPEQIKREVRQRCGFGCVICGLPIYEYHHIIDWAIVHTHEADNLTLLCDFHHKLATNQLMTRHQIETANAVPHNVTSGVSTPFGVEFRGDTVTFLLGGGWAKYTGLTPGHVMNIVKIDDHAMLSMRVSDEGHALISAELFNDENETLLLVADNEILYSSKTWDVTFERNRLTIREEKGSLDLVIAFELEDGIVSLERANLRYNGLQLVVQPEYCFTPNGSNIMSGCTAMNKDAIHLGQCTGSPAFGLTTTQKENYITIREAQAAGQRLLSNLHPPRVAKKREELMPVLVHHRHVTYKDATVYLSGNSFEGCEFLRCTFVLDDMPTRLVHCSFDSCVFRIERTVHDAESLHSLRDFLSSIETYLPQVPPEATS